MLEKELAPSLAQKLYTADEVRLHEHRAANAHSIDMYTLMQRAGSAVYKHSVSLFPSAVHYLILVGAGNNAGDGYVVALNALKAGKNVQVSAVNPTKELKGDAKRAQQAWFSAGGSVNAFHPEHMENAQIIIDGLLGSGLKGTVTDEFKRIIKCVNSSNNPILSIDIPSGLDANTGGPNELCIQATATVTFIGVKQGLVTGAGKQACGQLIFDDLGVGKAFAEIAHSSATMLTLEHCKGLTPRALNSHKGNYGRLLCIGSTRGMSGAIRMCSEAALRTGAGLVKVYTHKDSIAQICMGRPELMVTSEGLNEALMWASCIVIGPGLGQNDWSRQTYDEVMAYCQQHPKPVVIDADALTLHAQSNNVQPLAQCVVTPHSAEAGRLLGLTATKVETDRFFAARSCATRYFATCILKGPGSIVDNGQHAQICSHGNPGMASGGMGDVLAGVVGSLLCQGLDAQAASAYAVSIHAKAGDIVAQEFGQRGLLAGDLFTPLRRLINEK